VIFHLLSAADWAASQASGQVRPASLDDEGFVHCSTADQLPGVVARFYAGVADLLVLSVDVERLHAELRWEPPAHAHDDPAERFPHVYGPLPVTAVVAVEPWPSWREAQGA
jgi:uncharacterized protein (DUF952 family)